MSSSSPQMSKPDSGGDLALRATSSTTTSSPPPPPLSSSQSLLSSSQSKLNNYTFPYFNNRTTSSSSIELQEETILEKQTVRISPSLHKKDVAVPITTYFMNGQQLHHQHHHHHQQRRIATANGISCSLKSPLRCILPTEVADGIAHSYDTRVTREDKECQTEDFLENIMDNRVTNGIVAMENGVNSKDQRSNYHLYPKVIDHRLGTTAMVDRGDDNKQTRTQEFLSPQTTETDSKDRELEHIDIVISESKYISDSSSSSSSNDVVDVAAISTQPKQNGTAHSPNLNELKSVADFYDDKRHQAFKDDEEDTCCMNCFLITLNICDCVIL